MCGLFGYAGKVRQGKEEMAIELMQCVAIASEIRGIHSTGVALSWGKDISMVVKDITRPLDFVTSAQFTEGIFKKTGTMPEIMMGHNRWASRGAVTINNTHPFSGRRFALAHNGTANSSADRLERKYKLECKGETDSERFLRAIEVVGFKNVHKILEASENYSFTLLDKRAHKVYFMRDSDRPLYMADLREHLGIRVWASTREILLEGLKLAGWEHVESVRGFNTRPYKIYYIDMETLELEECGKWNKPAPVTPPSETRYARFSDKYGTQWERSGLTWRRVEREATKTYTDKKSWPKQETVVGNGGCIRVGETIRDIKYGDEYTIIQILNPTEVSTRDTKLGLYSIRGVDLILRGLREGNLVKVNKTPKAPTVVVEGSPITNTMERE